MGAILGIFDPSRPPVEVARVRQILARMSAGRGRDRHGIWRDAHAVLAVSRLDGEPEAVPESEAFIAHDGRLTVVADATLRQPEGLLERLRGLRVPVFDLAPCHLIMGAYRTWGADCVSVLAGQFAFVVWDGTARRVFGACGSDGDRRLHRARWRSGLVVASSLEAIEADPEYGAFLDGPSPVELTPGSAFTWDCSATVEGSEDGVREAGAVAVRDVA